MRRTPLISLLIVGAAASCSSSSPTKETAELHYVRSQYYEGLAETVTVVKTPFYSNIIHADGTTETLHSAQERDKAALHARYGSMGVALGEYTKSLPADAQIDVAFRFRPDIPSSLYLNVRAARVNSERVMAANALANAIDSQTTTFIPYLRSQGVDNPHGLPGLPWALAKVDVATLHRLALDSAVTSILDASPTTVVEHNTTSDPVGITEAPSVAWPGGLEGGQYAIGLVDVGVCTLADNHALFSSSTISYTGPTNQPCVPSVTDCTPQCGDYGVCSSSLNLCVQGHATEVSSVISQIAPKSKILYATEGEPSPNGPSGGKTVAGSLLAVGNAYNSFRQAGVPIVNESYGVNDNGGGAGKSNVDGVVEDEYARTYQFLLTKSAGNRYLAPDEEACPHTLNSICVGAMTSTEVQSCFSSYVNPGKLYSWSTGTDREEPDVVAFGGNGPISSGADCNAFYSPNADTIIVADETSTNATKEAAGTSLSAPAVAAMLELAFEYCDKFGQPLDPLTWRAVVRDSADINVDGWKYSTLNTTSPEHKDGAGGVHLASLVSYCGVGGGGPFRQAGGGTIDLTHDGSSDPPGGGGPIPDDPPGGTRSTSGGLSTLSHYTPQTGDHHHYYPIATIPKLVAGNRVRATVAWNACASTDGVAPGAVGTDFDLFLWRDGPNKPYYGSQTVDDNNEGFDITLQPGDDDDYTLYIAWPDDATGCGDTPGLEQWAYAFTVWQ